MFLRNVNSIINIRHISFNTQLNHAVVSLLSSRQGKSKGKRTLSAAVGGLAG